MLINSLRQRWHARLRTLAIMLFLLAACGGEQRSPGVEQARRVAEQAGWSENVTLSFSDDDLIVRSDGLPRHELARAYHAVSVVDHQTTYQVDPRALRIRVAVPLQPRLAAAKTSSRIGLIGIAISGALLYSPYEADGKTLAMSLDFERDGAVFIDDCNGHPNPFAIQYHYHGVPSCITRQLDRPGEHSRLLGYLLDGFPVYGPQDAGGAPITPASLDECNGHAGPTPEFPQGVYHYHITVEAPYTMPCYSGEVSLGTSDLAVLARGVDIGAYWLPITAVVAVLLLTLALALRGAWRSRWLRRASSSALRALLLVGVAVLVLSADVAAFAAVAYLLV